jgi:hypothetical protein
MKQARGKATEIKVIEVCERRKPWRTLRVEVIVPRIDGEGWSDIEVEAMDLACETVGRRWGLSADEAFAHLGSAIVG